MSWRHTARKWAGQQSRKVQRVAAQGYERARQAGRVTARRVLAIQTAARLPAHLMRRSAQSVAGREPARPADAAWRAGYMDQVQRRMPELAEPAVPDDFLPGHGLQNIADAAEAPVINQPGNRSSYTEPTTPRPDWPWAANLTPADPEAGQ